MTKLKIHEACFEGKIEEGQQISMEQILSVDEDQRLPIHHAVSGSRDQIVQLLINSGSPVDVPDESGWTPLHIAASIGNLKIVQLLLEKCDVSLNAKNNAGCTPLMYSISKQHEEVTIYLLDCGADPTLTDKSGQNALHRAASRGTLKIVKELLKRNKSLLNRTDNSKNTPLHLAVEEERVDIASVFMENDANVSIKNSEDKTPLDLASHQMRAYLKREYLIDE